MPISKRYQAKPYVKVKHPEWCKNASLYQINTRQFTPEGTFCAAEKHLRRIKELGCDIIWLMPIHEIGITNRKGTLGSPYAVRDYYSVNPEFGTLKDFKHFVRAAHRAGLYVIIDWVANHTASDCNLVDEHPEWYARDWKGDLRPTPWHDWTDVVDLDYSNPELREYMATAMKYWVRETGIDGFRCDVAGFVPVDFWNTVRKELDAIKPVFMLAEWESRDLLAEAFDMTYGWSWFNALQAIAAGKANPNRLYIEYAHLQGAFPEDAISMLFVTNHDKNCWNGTEFELFGNAVKAAIVLTVLSEGMPLIYNGQEAGNTKRLSFFEKDPIQWRDHEHGELYRKLFKLKKKNSTLWNGKWGSPMIHVPNTMPDRVLSFVRQNDRDKVFAVFNFSRYPRTVKFLGGPYDGKYVDYFGGEKMEFPSVKLLRLEPWEFRVFVQR